jgi:hypothetical protein
MPSWATEGDWSKGMISDAPRAALPPSTVVNSVDYLLDSPGIATKRGGTTYAGPAMTGATYAGAVIYADFTGGSQLLGVGNNGSLYGVTAGTTTLINAMGAAYVPICKPVYHSGGTKQYVIIPTSNGSAAFKKYNGTTVAAAVASVPKGKIVTTYKSRLVVGNDGTNKVRSWFSPATVASGTDIDQAWDTTNAWVDSENEIVGYAPLQNSLLILSHHQTERLTGTTPPPGTDFDHAPVGRVGCTDARSITIWQNYAIFANQRSIFMTNGVGFKDLLSDAGMVKFWQGSLTAYDPATWTISSGLLWNKYLWVSVMNGATFVTCLMCNLPRNAWWKASNIKAVMWGGANDVRDELYYADRSTNRIVKVADCWNPSAANKNDADGTAVAPVWESRVIQPTASLKTYGLGYVNLDMRDAGSDNPTMAVAIAPGVEATTFSAVAESPLSETTDMLRRKITLSKLSQGLTVRLTQSGASSKTELYAVECEVTGMGEEYGGQ